LLALVCYANAT
jgi:hypothetical protein